MPAYHGKIALGGGSMGPQFWTELTRGCRKVKGGTAGLENRVEGQ